MQDHEFVASRGDGSEVPVEIGLSPIEAEGGVLIVAAIRDLTARKRTEATLRASEQIHSTLVALLELSLEPISLEEQLARTLDVLFDVSWVKLESKGVIFLSEGDPPQLVMKAQRGLTEELASKCCAVPFGRCLCGEAAATGQIVFASDMDERHEIRLANMQPHGHYCVPIRSHGHVLGVINLYLAAQHRHSSEEERYLAAVANVLAGIITRRRSDQRLREKDAQLLAAQRIQEHLLPQHAPTIPGFDIAGRVYPAEFAGGDFFDYLPVSEDSLGIVVADVSGHDFSAALLTASSCAHLRSFVEGHSDIGEVLSHANSILCRETEDCRFVTLLFACLEPETRLLRYVNAGHPSGCVLNSSGDIKATLQSNTLPLSIELDIEFPIEGPIRLEAGDIVILMTDGILEAHSPSGEMFGTERMLACVRANRHRAMAEIIGTLRQAVRDFTQHEKLLDDVTVVGIKVE
jgi:serine phosphatase RsbU (regulator of sigma subunit)